MLERGLTDKPTNNKKQNEGDELCTTETGERQKRKKKIEKKSIGSSAGRPNETSLQEKRINS